MRSWASPFPSLSLSVFICKMGVDCAQKTKSAPSDRDPDRRPTPTRPRHVNTGSQTVLLTASHFHSANLTRWFSREPSLSPPFPRPGSAPLLGSDPVFLWVLHCNPGRPQQARAGLDLPCSRLHPRHSAQCATQAQQHPLTESSSCVRQSLLLEDSFQVGRTVCLSCWALCPLALTQCQVS